MFSQASEGPDPCYDPEEEGEVRLKELETDRILLKPDQQKDTPLPSSSFRNNSSTCSQDLVVSSPAFPPVHQSEHANESIEGYNDSKSIGSQRRDEVLPGILISNSDGEEGANDVRNKVTENEVNDSVSSKLVVVSQKFPFNLNETHCNLDATIPYTPSMTTSVSSEGTSHLVTTLSAISSDVLGEEDIENSKYNLEVAPVCC